MATLVPLYAQTLHRGELSHQWKGKAMPDVYLVQQQFVRYPFTEDSVESAQGWSKSQDAQSNQTTQWASLPDSVSLTIEQAPMEWALPVRKEQHMRPAFRISVVVKSRLAGVLPLRITPHILTEEELLNSHKWQPTPQAGKACRFLRHVESQTYTFSFSSSADQQVHHHLYEFPYIEFERPSSLRMVYILFYTEVPTGAVVYSVLSVPTICMSRADQRVKATQNIVNKLPLLVNILNHLARANKAATAKENIANVGAPVPLPSSASQPGEMVQPQHPPLWKAQQSHMALCNTLGPLWAGQNCPPLANNLTQGQTFSSIASLLAQSMVPHSAPAPSTDLLSTLVPLTASNVQKYGADKSSGSQLDDLSADEIQVLHALHALWNAPAPMQLPPAPAKAGAETSGNTTARVPSPSLACADSKSPFLLSAAAAATCTAKEARGSDPPGQTSDAGLEAHRISQSLSETSHDTRTRGAPSICTPASTAQTHAEPGHATGRASPQKRVRLSSDKILTWGLQAARAAAAGLPEPSLPGGLQDIAPLDAKRRRSTGTELTLADVPKTGPFALLREQWPTRDTARNGGSNAVNNLPRPRLSEGVSAADSALHAPPPPPQPPAAYVGPPQPPANAVPLSWPPAPPPETPATSGGLWPLLHALRTPPQGSVVPLTAAAPAATAAPPPAAAAAPAVEAAIAAMRPEVVQLLLSLLLQVCAPPMAPSPVAAPPAQPQLSPAFLQALLTPTAPAQVAQNDPQRILETLRLAANSTPLPGGARHS